MQGSLNRSFQCEKHLNQKTMFVCAVNDWHFEPLCQLCTPGHTQNHAKRLKINLQAFQSINKKVLNGQVRVCEIYDKQIQRVKELLKEKKYEDLIVIKELKIMQEKTICKIRDYFNDLNLNLIEKLKLSMTQNTLKLQNLQSNLLNEIKSIKQISQPELTLQQWKNSAKKIYFEDKLQSYLEESNEIIQEYEQKNHQITSLKRKQLFTDQQKFFTALLSLISTEVKGLIGYLNESNMKLEQKKKPVKERKPIIKTKRKSCKNCNQQMQYLTQNKKHLICRYCNCKERNYIKKPI